jgi:hypothetical protein
MSILTILSLGGGQLYAQNENLTQMVEQIVPEDQTLCGSRLILCVSVEYESPTLIVLNGEYFIGFSPETYTDIEKLSNVKQ